MRRASLLAAACFAAAAAPSFAADAAAPPPERSLAVADGLEATLFAAEPLLSSPSDIDVDSRGRVWLCEVLNYRGKKDTRPEGDRILVLEDTDGDGTADKQVVFHQGRDVDSALGICVIGEGPGRKVIVSCAPDVFIFHDDDGDLKADRRESLFAKTGIPQHDHSVHAFVVGPDGRWYFNFGNTGRAVHDRDGNPVKDRFGNDVNNSGKPYREGMVFRCRPDGTDFEVLGHNFRNNYEVAVDSFGTLWQSDNDDDGNRGVRINFVMEYGNYGYKDELTGAGWQVPRTNLEPEVPLQHWHQNDPGVVPNLLLTGAGSPCGICVYEGSLLPERYRGALIHCDAGPNAVRAYHVTPQGAGFTATMEPVVDGSADKWFRPCDVCVAPDGSLIVADWHDPGVGGHGMGDIEKGRLYRIAPHGSKWSVPAVDLATAAGAAAALASPNLCTRAMALERLTREPEAAAVALEAAAAKPQDGRHAARLAWALGMLPGRAEATVQHLAASGDARMQIIALRMCRLTKGDVTGLVETLASDPKADVRRECAIALKGIPGERADQAWATLASQHTAGDRWELEALGIGADGLWDGRLDAWLAKTSGPDSAPGREIVWRSRGTKSAAMLCLLIDRADVTTAESLALIRALDFQDQARVGEAIRSLLAGRLASAAEEKRRIILPELVVRLAPEAAADPALAATIDEAAGFAGDSRRFVEIVERFRIKARTADLVRIAATTADEALATAAVGAALALGAEADVRTALADPSRTDRLRAALRRQGGKEAATILASVGDAEPTPADAPKRLLQRGPLPPLADLMQQAGDVGGGQAVFAGVGTCAKCHVVGSEGKNVGPNLSGIGAKLSRQALYESILMPSAAISHNYETYTAVLDDGRSVTGLLVSQTPEQVVLKPADGVDATLAAKEIEELVKQPISLMPADLANTLSAQELADVVAWLETLRVTDTLK
jgi:putative membrane-bound dehydrogenase-like protein